VKFNTSGPLSVPSRRTFLRALAVAPLLSVQAAKLATAEGPIRADWPTFLGPTRNNISTETGLLLDWPEEGPPQRWERPVGDGYGPPVVAKGRLVVFHRLGDEEVVECVDAEKGETVHWRRAYQTRYVDRYGYNGGPRSSPCIDGDRVYTFGAEGVLTCVSLSEGERIWQRTVNKDYRVPQGFFGAGVAPVVDDGLVFINVGGPDGAGIAAFDAMTGETVWKSGTDQASYSSPIVATVGDMRLVIFHTADGLLVAEAKTGEIRYRYPFRSETYESAIAATPVLTGDKVFLSGTYNIGAVVLQLAPDGLKTIWRDESAMQNHWATSVYHDGLLYGMDGRHERGSNFRCIEFDTGKVRWTADQGLGRASFFMAEGHLVALGERGRLALIEVSPEGYKEKARVRVSSRRVWTPPILAQGRLYIRNEREVKCFDLRAPQ
jgi:outer membrane protein assembly factor BamB